MTTTTHTAMHHDPSAAALAVAEYEAEQRRAHDQRQHRDVRIYALGRIFIAALFIVSGAAKIFSYSATVSALNEVLPDARMMVPLGIAIELVGGALLLLGLRTRAAAVGLIAYLATVTLLVHHDLSEPLNRSFALGNLAFAGALMLLFAHGAGALSLDRATHRG
ncbi:MAG: DoxX family protein [Archangiaceae bacterium]|nr:DoxX family protein [Archangiaceae bacterium]